MMNGDGGGAPNSADNNDSNSNKGRMAEHIAFFYNPGNPGNKIETLRRVVTAAESYSDLYRVDVMVHTNKIGGDDASGDGAGLSFDLNKLGYNCTLPVGHRSRCPVVTIKAYDMGDHHPHYLTWFHRKAIARQLEGLDAGNDNDKNNKKGNDPYNIYMYVEDDVLFTRENLNYFLHYSQRARDTAGCALGFVRLPDPAHTGGTDYFRPNAMFRRVVRHRVPVHDYDANDINDAGGNGTTAGIVGEWARFEGEANYWGGWIMEDFVPGDDGGGGAADGILRAFASSQEFPLREVNPNLVREMAAWGWNSPKRISWSDDPRRPQCTVVPLVESKTDEEGAGIRLVLHPGARTYHMDGGKYVHGSCRSGKEVTCGKPHKVYGKAFVRYDSVNFNLLPYE